MLLQTMFLVLAVMLSQTQAQGNDVVIGTLTEEQKSTIVDMHNSIRRVVQPTASNMLKMEWSEEAAKNAQQWLKKCSPVGSTVEERTVDGTVCGEIAMQTSYPSNWANIIDFFSSGWKHFKYGVGKTDPSKDVYGYTQMIWHNSHQVGCATGICPMAQSKFFHICRYCPSGNIASKLNTPYKEGPSCGDCPDSCENQLCINTCKDNDKYEGCSDLIQMYSCDESFIQKGCAASCNCPKKQSS